MGAAGSSPEPSAAKQVHAEGLDLVVFNAHDGGQVLVRVFPRHARLAEDVRRVALAALGSSANDEELRANLERGLRAWYPRLTVRTREGLAMIDEHDRVWYVMRDGRVPPDPGKDRLFAALASARDRKADSEAVLARARELVEASDHSRGRKADHG